MKPLSPKLHVVRFITGTPCGKGRLTLQHGEVLKMHLELPNKLCLNLGVDVITYEVE